MSGRYYQIWDVVNAQIGDYRKRRKSAKEGQNMKPAEYIEAAKARLNIESDYSVAKKLGVSPNHMTELKDGSRAIPLDMAFKLAITLEMDPAEVVADLEAQRAKNPQKRDFWTNFLARAAMVAGIMLCTLALNFSGISGNGAATLGGFRRPRYFV
jgi:plasmid maintenance system antidote protein VapI